MSGGITAASVATYASIASAGFGILNATGVLGGGKSSAPAPMVGAPPVMPSPDDEAARAAKRKALAGLSTRRGRQSTILESDTSGDLLG